MKEGLTMNKEAVNITNLMKLTKSAAYVDEVALVDEIERLYRFVRIFGLERTQVYYVTDKPVMLTADKLSERRRAIAVVILIFMGHSAIDSIFGIKGRVKTLLEDIKGIENCLSVRDFLDLYMNNK